MAGWLKRRSKLAFIVGLLKDQTAAGLARASGPFSQSQVAVVMATNHHESLPEEKYVDAIIEAGTGSRMQVSFCTRLLVKRLTKTQSWAVAIKCLVVLHRTILDGGFLFQDMLAHSSMKEGKEYLNFGNFRHETVSVEWELCLWVKRYGRYLDERLICARALKSHLDNRWKAEDTQGRMEFMDSGELLYQLEALQNLLQELCQCEPGYEPGEHPVIQGALVLVVMDSYKVYDEIRLRIKELFARVNNLQLSESLNLVHFCKRADAQFLTLETFLRSCKELKLFDDIPLLENDMASQMERQKLTAAIKSTPMQPIAPSYSTRLTTVGKNNLGGENTNLKPFNKNLATRSEQGPLHRTASQPISQPRRAQGMNGTINRQFPYAAGDLHSGGSHSHYSCDDLIDLSFGSGFPPLARGNGVHVPPPGTMQDLITF